MVYAGESCSKSGVARLSALGWGQCCSEGPTERQQLPFFMDNGAWAAFVAGGNFDGARFLRRIEAAYDRGQRPDFVVVPDVVTNAKATFELSARWHPLIPSEWPKYLALQDGMEPWQVAQFMAGHPCQGVFIGGTAWFKNEKAAGWTRWAHDRGIRSHYARAGTERKFEHAMVIEADSLDSSRLSRDGRAWSDFAKCRALWLKGPHMRLFSEKAGVA